MIEYYEDADGKWRFRVKGENGEIVSGSEGYASKANAKRGVQTLRRLLSAPEPDKPVTVMLGENTARAPSEVPAPSLSGGSLWKYKGSRYQIVCVHPNRLVQFKDEWRPAVEYTNYPDIGRTYYRSDREFASKFERA